MNKLVILAFIFCIGKSFGFRRLNQEGVCHQVNPLNFQYDKHLPVITRKTGGIAVKNNYAKEFCGLRASCCEEDREWLLVKKAFVEMDIMIELLEFFYQDMLEHPKDLDVMIKSYMGSILNEDHFLTQTLTKLITQSEALKDYPPLLELIPSFSNLVRSMSGYLAGGFCSVCDPLASGYITNDTIFIHEETCEVVSEAFVVFLRAFSKLLGHHPFRQEFASIYVANCEYLNPDSSECKLKTVLKMYDTLNKKFFHEGALRKMFSGSEEESYTKTFFCVNVFKGLFLDVGTLLNHFRGNLKTSCPVDLIKQCDDIIDFSQMFEWPDAANLKAGSMKTKFLADKTKSYDLYTKEKKYKLSRLSFTRSEFDSSGNWHAHSKHGGHGILYNFFKFLIELGILGGLAYGGYVVYQRWKESDSDSTSNEEYYSMLSGM